MFEMFACTERGRVVVLSMAHFFAPSLYGKLFVFLAYSVCL